MLSTALKDTSDMAAKTEWSLYSQVIKANSKFVFLTHGEKSSIADLTIVGKKLVEVLTSVKPKHHYAFGASPPSFVRLLSSETYLWIWQKVFGL